MNVAFGYAVACGVLLTFVIAVSGRLMQSFPAHNGLTIMYATGFFVVVPLVQVLARMDKAPLGWAAPWWVYVGFLLVGLAVAFADFFGLEAFKAGGSPALVGGMIASSAALAALVSAVLGWSTRPTLVDGAALMGLLVCIGIIRGNHPPVEATEPATEEVRP